jgi:L-ascorbate metabolism protein UlaG (beta-lactamase superfamily)
MREAFTNASDEATPTAPVDVARTDPEAFASDPASGLRVTWFGHSSALLEVDGTRILTDPIWSERSGPVEFAGPQRFYEPTIALADLPRIDAVVISHDHWDHLDMRTVQALGRTGTRFVVPLGVGAHLERWDISPDRITELDWWGTTSVAGVELHATPARHQSGRLNPSASRTLWAGWAITTPRHRVWYSGDSGFHDGLDEIGRRLGPFDVALVESGQYDEHWPDVHYGPELAVEAARRVRAAVMVPVHWGLFSLAPHAWTEPVERVIGEAACVGQPVRVLRPGEPSEPTTADGTVEVGGTATATKKWWPELRTRTAADAPVLGTRAGRPEARLAFQPCTTRG